MKKIGIVFFFSLYFIFMQSCSRCKGDDINTGIIVSDVPDNNCIWNQLGDKCVIRNQAELDSLNLLFHLNCDSIPAVDFNSFSILAYIISGNQCKKFIRNVSRDDSAQKYFYTITVRQCPCYFSRHATFPNAVLVPALPAGYSVEFIFKEE